MKKNQIQLQPEGVRCLMNLKAIIDCTAETTALDLHLLVVQEWLEWAAPKLEGTTKPVKIKMKQSELFALGTVLLNWPIADSQFEMQVARNGVLEAIRIETTLHHYNRLTAEKRIK